MDQLNISISWSHLDATIILVKNGRRPHHKSPENIFFSKAKMHWYSRDHIADDKLSIILTNVFGRPAVIVGLLFTDKSHHQHNFF